MSTKEEQLWQAATDGDLELVRKLSEDPAVNVEWTDETATRTPFYRACFFGRLEVVEFLLGDPRVNVNCKQKEGATPICGACSEGRTEVVARLLMDPRIDVNEPTIGKTSGFYWACTMGRVGIVAMLLADSRVEVNGRADDGATPFFSACEDGRTAVVSLLLKDPRIDVNLAKSSNSSPLWVVSQNGNLPEAQLILASGREIEVGKISNFDQTTALQRARAVAARSKPNSETEEVFKRKQQACPLIADLITRFEEDPTAVRAQLAYLPHVRDSFIGPLFALVVFVADNYARARPETPQHATRFFGVCSQLPLELQMVLCNRVFASPKDLVLARDSEPGFRWLATPSTWLS